jgi:hypothetical protein
VSEVVAVSQAGYERNTDARLLMDRWTFKQSYMASRLIKFEVALTFTVFILTASNALEAGEYIETVNRALVVKNSSTAWLV